MSAGLVPSAAVPVIPVVDDLDTGEFFRAAGRGELAVCECASCGHALHMPLRWCHRCDTDEVVWRRVAPTGRIHSYSVITHQIHADFPVPYTVLLIDLDDAPQVRLIGRLAGRPQIAIGDPVCATFLSLADSAAQADGAGAGLPIWHHGIHPED
jgi:uncharacterized protein